MQQLVSYNKTFVRYSIPVPEFAIDAIRSPCQFLLPICHRSNLISVLVLESFTLFDLGHYLGSLRPVLGCRGKLSGFCARIPFRIAICGSALFPVPLEPCQNPTPSQTTISTSLRTILATEKALPATKSLIKYRIISLKSPAPNWVNEILAPVPHSISLALSWHPDVTS